MAELSGDPSAPPATPVDPATPPKVLPWALVYTLGRILVAVALIALLWLVGLGGFPGIVFGLLLSMPASYVLLRSVRDRLTEALAARSLRKRELRARLQGTDAADPA
jgi:Protein of unknown function (DUF4229)